MRAFVDHADGRKEKSRQESVRNHLERGSAKSHRSKRRETEENQAQVANGTVSGNVLEVLVAQCNEGAENHVENQERHHVREPDLGGFRHQEHRDAKTTVSAHLHHHAGGKHRDCRRSGGVTVRTPEVEREQGTRNGKSHEHERERPHLEIHRERHLGKFDKAETVDSAFEVEAEECRQDHRGAERKCQRQLLTAVVLAA